MAEGGGEGEGEEEEGGEVGRTLLGEGTGSVDFPVVGGKSEIK